ncbi:MAG: pilin [Patescibacteria group bacterium]|nr:pilin [Patescibacteria group bacterium]
MKKLIKIFKQLTIGGMFALALCLGFVTQVKAVDCAKIYDRWNTLFFCDLNNNQASDQGEKPYTICATNQIGQPCCAGTSDLAVSACAQIISPPLCGVTRYSSVIIGHYCDTNLNSKLDVFDNTRNEGIFTDCVGSPSRRESHPCCIGPDAIAKCTQALSPTAIPATIPTPITLACGNTFPQAQIASTTCTCPHPIKAMEENDLYCCGWIDPSDKTKCLKTNPGGIEHPFDAPSSETFDSLNPLWIGGGDSIQDATGATSPYASDLSTPGGIISRLLDFIFPIAGLILFVMLVWGGFEMLIGAPTKKSIEAGKNRITAAIIGFLLLFASYWLMQIVEVVFGIVVL